VRSSLPVCVCLARLVTGGECGNQSKNTPLDCMINNFKKDLMETIEFSLANKVKVLCEVYWPAFAVGWPLEGSLDKTVINEVDRVIVKKKKNLMPRRMGKENRVKLVFKNQTLLFI
jgi:hypothetical protein